MDSEKKLSKNNGSASFLVMEAGLCALIVVAPLPFGSVGPAGRLTFEILALGLTALWALTALREEVALPPRSAQIALLGLLAIAALQLVPLPGKAIALVSPRTAALRLGLDPAAERTLSLAGAATASALRTGAALVGVLFVATSVVAARGAGRLALAALLAAAFEGLYGILVLASGHDRIWNVPKTFHVDSATGTFVNRNHFAAFLAATLPLGLGYVVAVARRARAGRRRPGVLSTALGPEGSRALLLGLLTLMGIAGLFLSFSRAGTLLGLVAVTGTAGLSLRVRPVYRWMAIAVIVAIAAIPLLELGAEGLALRYRITGDDLMGPGGRMDVARDTLRMIAAFPVAGVGFGAFVWAYPVHSSPQVLLHFTHAHNDVLQLGAEGGLPALALLAVALAALLPRMSRFLRDAGDPVAIGAAFGLSALLVHALVDFNFHIPANAAMASILAGILFGASWTGRS